MSNKKARTQTYVIGEGGSSFLDLALEVPEIMILIGSPGHLITGLASTTNLSFEDGLNPTQLAAFVADLDISIYCGFTGLSNAEISIDFPKTPQLKIGVGPTAMYSNEMIIKTRSGITLDDCIRAHLTQKGRRNMIFGLVPLFREVGSHHNHSGHHTSHVHIS